MSRIGCGADYGGAGSSGVMQFWASWAAASGASYMNMLALGTTWLQSLMMGGNSGTARGNADTTGREQSPVQGFFEEWYRLAAFPFEWWSRARGTDIPVVGIALDTNASSKGPYRVMTPYCVPKFIPHKMPLHKLGNPDKEIPEENLDVALSQDGNTLSVSLVDLHLKPEDKGYYIGMVWVVDNPEFRPLAILNVYVT